MNVKNTSLLASVILSLFVALPAMAGTKDGGGGDLVGMEFTQLGQTVSYFLSGMKDAPPIAASAFSKAVSRTYVRSADHTILKGDEVDAINYPEKSKILVNRSRWSHATEDQKVALVFHEYLGILNAGDQTYSVSADFIATYAKEIEKRNAGVSQCTLTATLSLSGVENATNRKLSAEVRATQTVQSNAPGMFWIDFNDLTTGSTREFQVSYSGDADDLKAALALYSQKYLSHVAMTALLQFDEVKRLTMFNIQHPNWSTADTYPRLNQDYSHFINYDILRTAPDGRILDNYQISPSVQIDCQ